MASDYGYNFGFTRSNESMRWSEGGYAVPALGTFLLGSVVEIDNANDGLMKQAAANAAPVPGVVGLLVQELEWDRSIYQSDANLLDSYQMGIGHNARLAVITGGAGVKFWVRNNAAITRIDGRNIPAREMVAIAGLVAGDDLVWDGAKFAKGTGAGVLARVLDVNPITNRVDAVLTA